MRNLSVKKAVIPAAGLGTRFLPATKAIPKEMLPIVDTPTLQYIVKEAVDSGIEQILIITNQNKHCMENHFDTDFELEARLRASGKDAEADMINEIADMANIFYIRQKEPKGLGHAILCAQPFIGNERTLECDTVVVSFGIRKDPAAVAELASVIPETYVIGDCSPVGGTVWPAVRSGFDMAMEL